MSLQWRYARNLLLIAVLSGIAFVGASQRTADAKPTATSVALGFGLKLVATSTAAPRGSEAAALVGAKSFLPPPPSAILSESYMDLTTLEPTAFPIGAVTDNVAFEPAGAPMAGLGLQMASTTNDPVWVIQYSQVDFPGSSPPGHPSPVYTTVYVLVEAESGVPLMWFGTTDCYAGQSCASP